MDELQYPENLPSDELICLPFLDTDTSKDVLVANAVLARRGYPRWAVRLCRALVAPGLWLQLFDWDWCSLGIFDVFFGYSFIFAGRSLVLLLLGAYPWGFGGLGLACLLLISAWVGWRRRRQREAGDVA